MISNFLKMFPEVIPLWQNTRPAEKTLSFSLRPRDLFSTLLPRLLIVKQHGGSVPKFFNPCGLNGLHNRNKFPVLQPFVKNLSQQVEKSRIKLTDDESIFKRSL